MSFEEDLNTYLRANVPSVANRVKPVKLSQNTSFPALTFMRLNTNDLYSHDGYSELTTPLIRITVYAKSYEEVRETAKEVKDAMRGYTGMMGATDIGFSLMAGAGDLDLIDPDWEDSEGNRVYYTPLAFRIMYTEV